MSGNAFRTLCHLLWCAGDDEVAAVVAAAGSDVDDPVGAFHHVEVVLDYEYAVAAVDERCEGVEELCDVVRVEAGGRFVKDKNCRRLHLVADEIGELHTLVLASGECGGVLSEADISETDVFKRLEAAGYELLVVLGEEGDGFADGHIEDVADVFPAELDVEDVFLEAFAVAAVADECEVGHKLHFYCYDAGALAFVAASAVGVEGEVLRGKAELLCEWLAGEEVADSVVGFQICGGVGTGALANRVLIDELDMAYRFDIALDTVMVARGVGHVAQQPHYGGIEDATDKARLARAAHAGNDGEDVERYGDVDAAEIVVACSDDVDVAVPRAAGRRHGYALFAGEEAEGVGGS